MFVFAQKFFSQRKNKEFKPNPFPWLYQKLGPLKSPGSQILLKFPRKPQKSRIQIFPNREGPNPFGKGPKGFGPPKTPIGNPNWGKKVQPTTQPEPFPSFPFLPAFPFLSTLPSRAEPPGCQSPNGSPLFLSQPPIVPGNRTVKNLGIKLHQMTKELLLLGF